MCAYLVNIEFKDNWFYIITPQGQLVDLVQREVTSLLQSALVVALSVVRANPTVLEGLGARLEGMLFFVSMLISRFLPLFSPLFQLLHSHNMGGMFN